MSKITSQIAAAFAVASLVLPSVSRAASTVLTYFNVQTSTSPNFTVATTTTWPTGTPVTLSDTSVPIYLRYSVRAAVTNNANPGATSGYLIDADEDGIGETPQPITLGIGAFGAYVTNTSSQITPVANGGQGTAVVNSQFASVSSSGTIIGNNVGNSTTPASFIAGGTNSGAVNAGVAGNLNRLNIGANPTPANNNLFTNLRFLIPAGYSGSDTITTNIPNTSFAFVANNTTGNATDAPTYTNRNFSSNTDTLTGPGAITVITPEPTSLAVLGIAGAGLLARRRKA